MNSAHAQPTAPYDFEEAQRLAVEEAVRLGGVLFEAAEELILVKEFLRNHPGQSLVGVCVQTGKQVLA